MWFTLATTLLARALVSVDIAVDGTLHSVAVDAANNNLRHVASDFVRAHDLRPAAEAHAALLGRLREARRGSTVADWSAPSFWRGTGAVYVIWASNYSSGGPACLHALHNAANAAGFTSYMYTLNPRYATPNSVGIARFEPEMLESGDIVVVPESWYESIRPAQLAAFRARGSRWFAYALAAAQAGGTLPLRRRDAFQSGVAGGFALGHYIRAYYDLPVARALVLEAPLEAAYSVAERRYAAAAAAKSLSPPKEDLVVVDSDFALSAGGVVAMERVRDALSERGIALVVPRRLGTAALIALYERAKCVLDLYLPGPERLTNEGVLFDAYPVVTRDDNGGDFADKPFPSRFRVDPRDVDSIVAAVVDVVRNHAQLGGEFARFKRSVREMATRYAGRVPAVLRSARYAFVIAAPTLDAELMLGRALLSALHHFPLASIKVVVRDRASFVRQWQPMLEQLEERGFTDAGGGQRWHSVRFRDGSSVGGAANDAQHAPLIITLPLPLIFLGRAWAETLVGRMLAQRSASASVRSATTDAVLATATLDEGALPRVETGGEEKPAQSREPVLLGCAVKAAPSQLWRPSDGDAMSESTRVQLRTLARTSQLWHAWEAWAAIVRGGDELVKKE